MWTYTKYEAASPAAWSSPMAIASQYAASKVAAAFRDRYGIQKGDHVAILAANTPEWILSYWATVSLGAVVISMNGWWAGDEIRYGLELTTPKVLVADKRRLERLEGAPGIPVVVMEDEPGELIDAGAGAALSDVEIAEDDPAAILFTSGTTGRPKGAITTHRNFIAYVSCAFMLGARDAVRFPKGEDGPSDPTYIVTVHRVGYKFTG